MNLEKALSPSLHEVLERKLCGFEITLQESYVYGGLFLRVKLSDEIQKIITEIAKEFDIQDKIPNSFHITLAYAYKPSDSSTREMLRGVHERLKSVIIKSHDRSIILEAPKLCFFKDMTQFTPWADSAVTIKKDSALSDVSFLKKR